MLNVGHRAPEFTLADIHGEHHTLGKQLTLAIFFKTNCPTCQYAWPFYERLYQAYKAPGLQVLGISQHQLEKTRAYQEAYGATFPHLVDTDWQVSKAYDPNFVPTGFLIDRDKKILAAWASWNSEQLEQLSRQIAEQLYIAPKEIIRPDENVIGFKPG